MFKNKPSSLVQNRLLSNILSLGVLQVSNYILPLLTVPYLVRVLCPEYFRLLAFATATISYFMLVTDYGFNLSATRQISIHRDDITKVNQIFSAVMIIKLFLMTISFFLMVLVVFSFERFSQHWEVYFVTFGIVIGQVFFPVWLFQGMERMEYITYLNLGAKTFFTVCIFIFVKDPQNYLLVPLFTSLGFIVTGIFSAYLVRKEFNITYSRPPLSSIRFQLLDGWHVFYSSFAISMYTTSTTIILGLATNNTIVGYFSAANKIIYAVSGLYRPISQAIFPLISKKLDEDKSVGLAFINKTAWAVGSGMFVVSASLFLFSEPIVILLLGSQFQKSVVLLQIMAFLPFLIALSNIFGIQMMLNLGFKKEFSYFTTVAAFVGIGLALFLTPRYSAEGVSMTMLFVEILVTVTLGFFIMYKLKGKI